MKKRSAIVVVMLLAVAALLFTAWPASGGPESSARTGKGEPAAGNAASGVSAGQQEHAATEAHGGLQREPIAAPPAPTTGDLLLHVRFADDHSPASGVTMIVRRRGADWDIDLRRAPTDESGSVRFAELPPGSMRVMSHLGNDGPVAEVRAGETTEMDVELAAGLRVTGIVVAPGGRPVAGALVERSDMGSRVTEAVATTDSEGRFEVRRIPGWNTIGARAAGYSASVVRLLDGKPGSTVEVRLELGPAGGVIDGDVAGPDGAKVAGAMIRIGNQDAGHVVDQAGPPQPAIVRTDEQGRFHAIGIPVGTQAVAARAATFAPWTGTCEVAADQTAVLHVVLAAGAILRGVVRDGGGSPVEGADVELGNSWPSGHSARTQAGGTFEMTGLPEGDLEVKADRDSVGRASQPVRLRSGVITTCELRLSAGLVLRGRVRDESNAPVKANVFCLAGRHGVGSANTDAEGRFQVTNCPEDHSVTVSVSGPGFATISLTDVDPKAGELELVAHPEVPATASIVGCVVGPDGRPVANVDVDGWKRRDEEYDRGRDATDAEGRFRLSRLQAGNWNVRLFPSGHPEFALPQHELAAGATWDAGTIQLIVGGTAAMQIRNGDPKGVAFFVNDIPRTRTWAMQGGGGLWRSRVLAPGEYRLQISGKSVAAQSLPFSITAGEETMIEVGLLPGVCQRVEVTMPDGARSEEGASIEVTRDGIRMQGAWAARAEGLCVAEVCLAPGKYAVTATAHKLSGSATFTVGDTAGPPVRVEVR